MKVRLLRSDKRLIVEINADYLFSAIDMNRKDLSILDEVDNFSPTFYSNEDIFLMISDLKILIENVNTNRKSDLESILRTIKEHRFRYLVFSPYD